MKAFIKRLWKSWKEIAGYIGDFQARVILTVFYFVVLAPFGLLVRIFSDPLGRRNTPDVSGWNKRGPEDIDMASARRQF